jgi:excisionase family DNA binding protein
MSDERSLHRNAQMANAEQGAMLKSRSNATFTEVRQITAPEIKPEYMTRKQAAAMLSCSDQTISKMHKAGRLPFYYLGRHAVRIKADDVNAMLSPRPHAKAACSVRRVQ